MNRYSKVWNQFEDYLSKDQDPKKLSFTVSLGMILGIFPIPGTTTLLCILAAIPLKLNMIIIQLANYLVYPLQLILLVPMIRYGGKIFGAPAIPNIELIMDQGIIALKPIWQNCLCGVLLWFLLGIPVFMVLYSILLRIFSRIVTDDTI